MEEVKLHRCWVNNAQINHEFEFAGQTFGNMAI